jgi:uncharacterized protein (DUF488 family)
VKVFSIGHSTRTVGEFLKKLVENDIEAVIDVRSRPYSSRFPHFNRHALYRSLSEVNISYIFKGNNLGGLDENVDFDKAIDEVYELSKRKRVVLLCSEGDFHKCHRYNTLAPILEDKGAKMYHILWDTTNVNEYEEKKVKKSKIS